MTWVIIIWSAFILIWAIAGGSDAANTDECKNEATESARQLCEDATDVGAGLGVAAIFFLGFVGFIVLSLIWFMTRPKGRECPACGENVKKGKTACPKCGHDFAAAARGTSPTPTPPEATSPP
jgi:hypothetical protein